MTGALTKIPEDWEVPEDGSPLEPGAVALLNFVAKRLFDDYEPAEFSSFEKRLIRWLNNLDTEVQQKELLALLLDVFYVGRKEFQTLYRATFRNAISRWLIDRHGLDPFAPNLEQVIIGLADNAWICPISDSLRINSFLKVTGLKSRDKRPDWRSLEQLGNKTKIKHYVKESGTTDLILLEDFVGSGTQAEACVKFASSVLPTVRILVAPLVVCPKGDRRLIDVISDLPNVSYSPTLVLPVAAFHSYDDYAAGLGTARDEFIAGLADKMGFMDKKQCFGFKQTGARVVMFSNCPNNTLPLFHHESANWQPIFPRVIRE